MRATTTAVTVTSPQACRITGITYRQLDYWIRTGVITPQVTADGSGSRRRFSILDLRALAAIKTASPLLLGSASKGDRGHPRQTDQIATLIGLARDPDQDGAVVTRTAVTPIDVDDIQSIVEDLVDGVTDTVSVVMFEPPEFIQLAIDATLGLRERQVDDLLSRLRRLPKDELDALVDDWEDPR